MLEDLQRGLGTLAGVAAGIAVATAVAGHGLMIFWTTLIALAGIDQAAALLARHSGVAQE